jgi:hypothetical protein
MCFQRQPSLVRNKDCSVRFEHLTAVTMKSAVFWVVTPPRSEVAICFGGKFRPHVQGPRVNRAINPQKSAEKSIQLARIPEDCAQLLVHS